MPTPAELVKSKTDLVDLINGYVKLSPAGSNWKCRCPFHAEKTPSFMVTREKQVWHCFGCGRGGDAIAFVQEIEGMDFPEALRHLAARAGVELPQTGQRVSSRKAKLLEVLESASAYYSRVLAESADAEPARVYLTKRGITDESMQGFRLGFAPAAWDTLAIAMRAKGIPEDVMVEAGLVIKKPGGGTYDRFRGRIIFPIRDLSGNVVGFGGRIIEGVDAPGNAEAGKYINSPQSPVFDKGRVLFGLDRARRAIRQHDLAIVVEGNFDCIASHQAGIEHAVATCGTAFTEDHAHLLRRFTENVALAFDDDAGGRAAARRALALLFAGGFDARVIPLAGSKDPADLVLENPVHWQKAVGEARTGMTYLFDTTIAGADLSKVEDKKRVAKELLPWIARLPNPIEQEHFVQQLARRLAVPEETLRPLIAKSSTAKPTVESTTAVPAAVDRRAAIAERFLALLLTASEPPTTLLQELPPEELPGGPLRDLYKAILIHYSSGATAEPGALAEALGRSNPELRDRANILLLIGERDFGDLDPVGRARELSDMLRELRRLHRKEQLNVTQRQIADAEARKDSAAIERLTQEFQVSTEALRRLERPTEH
jgi:DNA primase